MIEPRTFSTSTSGAGVNRSARDHDQAATDALVAAIRKPLDVLEGAAEEAANGMLGRTKLGLLVAASGLIAALHAVDAEFARQYGPSAAGRRGLEPDRDRF